MIKTIKIKDLTCVCVPYGESRRIIYLIYPLIEGFSEKWITSQAEKTRSSIVMVYVAPEKWNDYLTPWPEPGETHDAEPFGGEGAEFLKTLQNEVIPQAEKALGINFVTERDIVGVSLGGLFTLWQWMLCDTFNSIACVSGSFWYSGFMEWFGKQPIPHKQGKAYFLLGIEEPKAHIKAFRSVGVNTENIVADLKKAGIDTTFNWVPGNHFSDPVTRAEKALSQLS